MEINRQILVETNLNGDKRIADFMSEEYKMTDSWKEEGLLEHLFAKKSPEGEVSGGVMVFNNSDIDKVKMLVESLPLFPFWNQVDYLLIDIVY